jgi:hypothetical protein
MDSKGTPSSCAACRAVFPDLISPLRPEGSKRTEIFSLIKEWTPERGYFLGTKLIKPSLKAWGASWEYL